MDTFTRGKPTGVPGEDEGWALDAVDAVERLFARVQELERGNVALLVELRSANDSKIELEREVARLKQQLEKVEL